MRLPGPTVRTLTNAVRRGVRHPSWLRETVRGRLRARAAVDGEFSLGHYAEFLGDVERTVTAAYGITASEYQALRSRVRVPPAPFDSPWSGGDAILALAGTIVLLKRPETVVETGVALGFTTAVMLAALEENGTGQLHSIDLPPLQVDASSFVGRAVPGELRTRWSLHVGPSQAILPDLARSVAPIDVFVHDADHSYAAQYEEFRAVWPHLAHDGTLISDDVSNPALVDFAAEVGMRPYLVAAPGEHAAVGLLVKSG